MLFLLWPNSQKIDSWVDKWILIWTKKKLLLVSVSFLSFTFVFVFYVLVHLCGRFWQTSEKQTNKTLKVVCMSSIITFNVWLLGSIIIIIMCCCFCFVFFVFKFRLIPKLLTVVCLKCPQPPIRMQFPIFIFIFLAVGVVCSHVSVFKKKKKLVFFLINFISYWVILLISSLQSSVLDTAKFLSFVTFAFHQFLFCYFCLFFVDVVGGGEWCGYDLI